MKYKNHNPFMVPKGYFNILEKKLLKKTEGATSKGRKTKRM